jgi:ADP-ribose pyrophosphatase
MNDDTTSTRRLPALELVESDDLPRVVPGDAERGEIQILSEELAWENHAARLFVDRVRFPKKKDGEHVEGDVFRLTDAPGKLNGAITVPITDDDRIILVRQFRHPVRLWTLEVPRGARERGETPEAAAAREIREEIGYDVVACHPLGRIAPDSGQLSSIPHLVAARVRRRGTPQREDTETIDRTVAMPYALLRQACERGEVIDGYTTAAVLRLAPYVAADGRISLPGERRD